MNRHVPCSPEYINIIGIPPITVEVSISKVQQLTNQVQKRMEHQVKED